MNHFLENLRYLTGRQANLNEKSKPETSEQQSITEFAAASAVSALIAYMSYKKKKKYDPNVPKSFFEACEYPEWCKAIDR